MALIPVVCPHCQTDKDVIKNGKTAQGKQRFLCRSQSCRGRSFMLNPSYPGRTPAVKEQIGEMSLNGSGIREISRVLHVSTRTVIGELKKTKSAQSSQ